ncbi:MAG: hypothetical protein IJW62_00440, partial [Clostridia bacterium]|nr:hypothetical protein [Clostridia bacterium]
IDQRPNRQTKKLFEHFLSWGNLLTKSSNSALPNYAEFAFSKHPDSQTPSKTSVKPCLFGTAGNDSIYQSFPKLPLPRKNLRGFMKSSWGRVSSAKPN